ncbi:MAG: nucleotide exchange factor GrpE [Bacilli bacterium]|nr:nucleotide exchange factor GrpE [Bacilli bacterium]
MEKEENIEILTETKEVSKKDKKQEKKVEKKLSKNKDSKLLEEIESLKLTNKKLSDENISLIEKVKIAQAESINYRRRKDEETNQLLKYANQDLIMELILVVDNFERAIKLDDNDLTDEVSKFLAGFKMMYANLTEILKKFGVEEINRVGEKFDPNQEQALLTDTVEDMEDEVVIEVLLKGYKLKEKVIRPASVKINQK